MTGMKKTPKAKPMGKNTPKPMPKPKGGKKTY